jgi:NADH-quinone oxidoreductase subunit F
MQTRTFDDIRAQAAAEWEALAQSKKPRIFVGTATCGLAAGAEAVLKSIEAELAQRGIEAITTQVGCIGLCYSEPMVDIARPGEARVSYGGITPDKVARLIDEHVVNGRPCVDLALGTVGECPSPDVPALTESAVLKPQVRIVLRRCGMIDPENINHYIATGGYGGLAKALKMSPDEVIAEVRKSGLRGRGGAGFPTGQKWDFCRKSAGKQKYIICNADEGDPGAFMNRSLLEGDPHSVLEGMLIGAYTIGASEGYIYCRAEYPLALKRLRIAMDRMEEYGLLGNDILGSGFSFHLKIKEGAGAFVCGEETALMASIEGKRGMPRSRPPFPAVSGLWGKPTNINNVETWANTAAILQNGAEWYASYGSQGNSGTKTFSLVGKVERTGLIEVPLGITLEEIINGIGGGMLGGKAFKAVQTGGPSGGCLGSDFLSSPVDYETLAKAGSIVGSGGMIVLDEDTCVVDLARYFLTFVQNESCGKCVPCRVGTRQMLGILERITQGEGRPDDIEQLQRLAETVRDGSLCALGGTAPNPVLTTLRYFRSEYEAHIFEKRCPARGCQKLVSCYILPDKCEGCGICIKACPVEAIVGGKRMVHIIDQSKCTKCGACIDVCPPKFSAIKKVSGEKIEVPSEPIPVTPKKKAAKAEAAE